ncbi:methyltransferase family protein [Maribacter sp. CXY002]|uniref:methyltransferase family protein n=1 Tax=Maribacter luteocoastalis TaxID=3407671 RepID=UPI003B682DFA
MELKLPPVVIFILFSIIMYLLGLFLPFGFFDFFGRVFMIKVLVVMAILVAMIALWQFYRLKTTIDPTNPSKTSNLVTSGIYQYTRNPMYLSMMLLLLALGIYLGNAFNILSVAGFVGYMNRYQIIPEERVLAEKFGSVYNQYLVKTRRWF